MKIAHVICTFPPYKGGMGNSAYNFAVYLARLKHQVTVITPFYNRPENELIDKEDKGFEILRIKPVYEYGNAAILPLEEVDWNQYDIVHLHYPFYGVAEGLAAKKRQGGTFKLVIHYHMDNKAGGWKGLIFTAYRKLMSNKILDAADIITCASLDYVKHGNLAKYYLKHPRKFVQIAFGVDSQIFSPENCPVSQTKNILFVGGLDRAHYFKGVDVLLKAFAAVSDKLANYRLLIVGRGDLLPDYQALANKLAISDKVEFITDADDEKLACIYKSSSFFVLPSINSNEAFGLVLLEAMASGLPVIATNLPGVRSVFRNGEQGYLVRPGDVEDLSKKILLLAESESRLTKMSEAARSLVEERYTWEKTADKLNELYYRIKYTPTAI